MKRLITTAMFLILTLPLLAAPAAAQPGDNGSPGNSGAAHACQQGGYLDYARADGSGFANSDECVSYAAEGGVLFSDCELAQTYPNTGINLEGFDLSGCDLSGVNLRHAYLYLANLSGANLSGADLYFALLHDANMRGANLSGANLSKAHLEGADLTGANLSGADLSKTELRDANLTGANLTDVIWYYTLCPQGSSSDVHGGTCEGFL